MKFWQITNTFLNNATFVILSPFKDSEFLFLTFDKRKLFPELFYKNKNIDLCDSLSSFSARTNVKLGNTSINFISFLKGMDLHAKEKGKKAKHVQKLIRKIPKIKDAY